MHKYKYLLLKWTFQPSSRNTKNLKLFKIFLNLKRQYLPASPKSWVNANQESRRKEKEFQTSIPFKIKPVVIKIQIKTEILIVANKHKQKTRLLINSILPPSFGFLRKKTRFLQIGNQNWIWIILRQQTDNGTLHELCLCKDFSFIQLFLRQAFVFVFFFFSFYFLVEREVCEKNESSKAKAKGSGNILI